MADSSIIALAGGHRPGMGFFGLLHEDSGLVLLPGVAETLPSLPGGDEFLLPVQGPDLLGFLDRATVASEPGLEDDQALALGAPTPNPTAGTVRLDVHRPPGLLATTEFFDALGRRVAQMEGAPVAETVEWDGRDGSGRPVAPGLYVVRVRAGDHTAVTRFTIVR